MNNLVGRAGGESRNGIPWTTIQARLLPVRTQLAHLGKPGTRTRRPSLHVITPPGDAPFRSGPPYRRTALALSPALIYIRVSSNIFRGFGGWPLRAAFFVLDQDDHPHHTGLEGRVAHAIAPALLDMGFELVRVAILGREHPTVQIMADRADGSLITVEDCEAISHAIGAILDVEDPIPGNWTLEVSSAGIDRPLTRVRDWNRFAGHLAKAELNMPLAGRKRFSGIVLGADREHGRLRLDDGSEVALPLADLRHARLVLTDALIEASSPQRPPN